MKIQRIPSLQKREWKHTKSFDKRYEEGKDKTRRIFTEHDFWQEFGAENCETLFSNREYVNKLAKRHRNIIQKFIDFVRDLWRRIVGYDKHTTSEATRVAQLTAKQLAQAEAMLAEALGIETALDKKVEIQQKTAIELAVDNIGYGELDTVYALRNDKYGNRYWHIETDKDIFKGITDTKQLQKKAYEFILHGDKGEAVNEIVDGEPLEFKRISAEEYVYGKQSRILSKSDKGNHGLYNKKMRIIPSVLDLIQYSNVSYDTPDHKNHKLFRKGFNNYRGRVRIDNIIFNYIVRVGKAEYGKVFYDINLEVEQILPSAKSTSGIQGSTSINTSISKNKIDVNTIILPDYKNDTFNFSIDTDTETLTPERIEQIYKTYEQNHVGILKPSKKELWGERFEWVKNVLTRTFEEIPESGAESTLA